MFLINKPLERKNIFYWEKAILSMYSDSVNKWTFTHGTSESRLLHSAQTYLNHFSSYLLMIFRTWPLKKILTREIWEFLFHAANTLLSLCSSSGSKTLLFFFYPLITLIFLPRIPLTCYLSLAWILYFSSDISSWRHLFTFYQKEYWLQILPVLGPYSEIFGLSCISDLHAA